MFETLATLGMLGSFWLFMTALNDSIELVEQKSEERREEYRQRAYAQKRKEWTINQNRRKLWAEVENENNTY